MPQVAGHLVVAEKTRTTLGDPPHIASNPNAYNLGSVGPDLALFLFDVGGRVTELLNFAVRFYQVIHDIKEFIDEAKETLLGPAEDMADWITGGLSTSLGGLLTYSFAAIKDCFAITILPGAKKTFPNPFEGQNYPGIPNGPTITVEASDLSYVLRMFGHPYTDDPPFHQPAAQGQYQKGWWWVDFLHYRRTGLFAKTLSQKAGNDFLKAYAAGYWTHIGGDVCGHPYVNAVVGGPFRTNVMRHMVMENIMDTWLWNHFKGEELLASGLHQYLDVGGRFQEIATLLNQTLTDVYLNAQPPQTTMRPDSFANLRPEVADWERAYTTMMLFTELSTTSYLEPPVPPPGSISEIMEEVLDSFEKTAQKFKKSFNPSGWSWWEWLLAPFLAALWALNLITKLLTLPLAVLIRIATLAPRWYIYYLQLALYEYIVNARWMLALTGWGKASRDDLVRPFAQLSCHIPPQRVGPPGSFPYPMQAVSRGIEGFWLVDPLWVANLGEEGPRRTEASPYGKYATPDVFITGPGYHQPVDRVLQSFNGAPEPNNTVDLEKETFYTPQFGNAVEFSTRLISGAYPPAPFDLDGDQGYGFLSWEGQPPSIPPTYNPKTF